MRVLERARFEEIMEDEASVTWVGDNAFIGLNIIAKYMSTKDDIITGAGHEVIYSVDVKQILNAGLTEEDAKKLRDINWMIDEANDCLACFV